MLPTAPLLIRFATGCNWDAPDSPACSALGAGDGGGPCLDSVGSDIPKRVCHTSNKSILTGSSKNVSTWADDFQKKFVQTVPQACNLRVPYRWRVHRHEAAHPKRLFESSWKHKVKKEAFKLVEQAARYNPLQPPCWLPVRKRV